MNNPDTSFFCFMHDVRDAGIERFCDDVTALGINGVTVATHYHASRDIRPRGTSGKAIDLPPGALYKAGAWEGYPPEMTPWTPAGFEEQDLLAELAEVAKERGIRVAAWTVFGFDERIGREHPHLCQKNAFGDIYTSDLCPANPIVYAGYQARVHDIAVSNPDAVLAESLHYQGVRLSRSLPPMDSWTRIALGLCFCDHCHAAATSRGVDAGKVAAWARDIASASFHGTTTESQEPVERFLLRDKADGELDKYLTARGRTVARLAGSAASIGAQYGVATVFMDQAAAEAPTVGPSIIDSAYVAGMHLEALSSTVLQAHPDAGYEVLGYHPEPEDVGRDLADYRNALGAGAHLRLALRIAAPDSTTSGNLKAKVESGRNHGVQGFDFYHYGLAASDALQRVADVVRELQ